MLQTSKAPFVLGSRIHTLYSILLGLALFLQTGCVSGGGSTTTQIQPPATLTYSITAAVYTKGTAIAANAPSSGGGAVVSYSVSPSLPVGLSLNVSSGIISGTPTSVTATASYTVMATNSGGSTTASISITVNDAAPGGLTYGTNPAIYTKGIAIAANTPSSDGGAVVAYSVSPALPAGLSLNTSAGVITGTPTAITATASYTVTGTNSSGSTTASVSITVNDAAPSGLTYTYTPARFTTGNAISTDSPTSGGGAVVSYSVSPALPAGLSLNTGTGVITGTPTTITTQAIYTVTATNGGGSTSVGLDFTVVPPGPAITAQPAGASKSVGSTATFSVTVSGSGPFTYQWQKNNINIPGATSSTYTTPILALSDSGTLFRALIVDAYASQITSNEATLTVTAQGSCVAPPSGMVAWYPGDGNANDIRGGSNGALQNGAAFTTGMVAQAFRFDGVNDHVSINTPGFMKGQSEATVDAWVRPLGPHSNGFNFGGAVFNESTSAPSGDYTRFGIFVRNDGSVLLGGRSIFNGETGNFGGVSTTAGMIPLNQWSHIAGTWSSTQGVRIYINGQLAASLNLQFGPFANTNSAFVAIGTDGPTAATAAQFNGDIDELEVFTRVLSQSDIQSIFAAGSAGKCKG